VNNSLTRYQQIADLITPILTVASQRQLDATLENAHSKDIAQGVSQEELQKNAIEYYARANRYAAVENARRIREWTLAILMAEREVDKKV
jgi:hypothetical protein